MSRNSVASLKRLMELNSVVFMGCLLRPDLLLCLFLCLHVCGCGGPSPDTPNDSFSQHLFLDSPDREWTVTITNITIVKSRWGIGRVDPTYLMANSTAIQLETNQLKINEIIGCLQTKVDRMPSRLVKASEQWHLLIYSRLHGHAHVVLDATDNPNVYAVTLNSVGTSSAISANCLSLMER